MVTPLVSVWLRFWILESCFYSSSSFAVKELCSWNSTLLSLSAHTSMPENHIYGQVLLCSFSVITFSRIMCSGFRSVEELTPKNLMKFCESTWSRNYWTSDALVSGHFDPFFLLSYLVSFLCFFFRQLGNPENFSVAIRKLVRPQQRSTKPKCKKNSSESLMCPGDQKKWNLHQRTSSWIYNRSSKTKVDLAVVWQTCFCI